MPISTTTKGGLGMETDAQRLRRLYRSTRDRLNATETTLNETRHDLAAARRAEGSLRRERDNLLGAVDNHLAVIDSLLAENKALREGRPVEVTLTPADPRQTELPL